MATARFRFHGELADFLPRDRRNSAFAYACARAATLKNAIEALGVPHTEAAETIVNGARGRSRSAWRAICLCEQRIPKASQRESRTGSASAIRAFPIATVAMESSGKDRISPECARRWNVALT